jgi:hypothetical protein
MPDVLIASGFGDAISGGGLFRIDGSRVERIDRLSSMGLAFDGRRLARILRSLPQETDVTEVAVYDERGVQRYLRLDDAAAPHDVAWDGENLVVVSAWSNAARWFSPSGELMREVRYPGPRDSWHLNCVTRRGDRWYASMFGDFGTFRAWAPPSREGEGQIVDLATGTAVVRGLTSPHSPRWVDGMWVVCNSDKDEVLAVDEDSGRVVQRVACGHWTRGLTFDDDFFYVGTCMRRATQESFGDAEIVVIDRRSWKHVDRIPVPAQEIYDVLLVPPALIDGLRRGFDHNPLRTAEFRQYRILSELGIQQPRSLWPSGEALPWSDFRCEVACQVPTTCAAGELLELALGVRNRSGAFFTSTPPAPVYASYKWLDPKTGEYLSEKRALRSKLPHTIFPAEAVEMIALVSVPDRIGKAILRVTLVQEGVSWFDDQDRDSAAEFAVEIVPAQRGAPDAVPIVG